MVRCLVQARSFDPRDFAPTRCRDGRIAPFRHFIRLEDEIERRNTMTKKRMYQTGRFLATVAGIALAFAALGPASAATFPDHDITFIVPYSPGGEVGS